MSAIDPALHTALQSWDFDHAVVWLLPVFLILYVAGFTRLHVVMPRRYRWWRLVSFTSGLTTLFLAIASPIDALGELLLSLHMTQHMLLMMVAAPLIWLGQPIVPTLRGVPARWIRYGNRVLRWRVLRRFGRAIIYPAFCWTALSAMLMVWHVPRLYELGLESEGWHAVQHACFFAGALLFWWPVIGVWPSEPVWPRWTMIPYLIGADLVNTGLSGVLTFSGRVLYPTYESVPRVTGLSPLDDQTLAGVVMWVPGSIAFLLPAVLLTVRLFDARSVSDRRTSSNPVTPRSGA